MFDWVVWLECFNCWLAAWMVGYWSRMFVTW